MKIKMDLQLTESYITRAVLLLLRQDGILGDIQEPFSITHRYGENYTIIIGDQDPAETT